MTDDNDDGDDDDDDWSNRIECVVRIVSAVVAYVVVLWLLESNAVSTMFMPFINYIIPAGY